METLLADQRRENLRLSQEVTRHQTLIISKEETIESLREEINKIRGELDRMNSDIMGKLTLLMNKPGANRQNMEDINRLLASMSKLDQEIANLKQNNIEILSKNNNNFYELKDQLNKATNEMKNSKRVEHVTRTIIQNPPPPPQTERIKRTVPVRTSVIRERSPIVRRYRQVPSPKPVETHTRCNYKCSQTFNHSTELGVEKCPICKVGNVNTHGSVSRKNHRVSNVSRVEAESTVFTEPARQRVYERRMSTEPLKNSFYSNNYLVDISTEFKEKAKKGGTSVRYSVDPLGKRVSHLIRNHNVERTSVKELDPYLINQTIRHSENVKGTEVRRSLSRRYPLDLRCGLFGRTTN